MLASLRTLVLDSYKAFEGIIGIMGKRQFCNILADFESVKEFKEAQRRTRSKARRTREPKIARGAVK